MFFRNLFNGKNANLEAQKQQAPVVYTMALKRPDYTHPLAFKPNTTNALGDNYKSSITEQFIYYSDSKQQGRVNIARNTIYCQNGQVKKLVDRFTGNGEYPENKSVYYNRNGNSILTRLTQYITSHSSR